jgi:[ribosomal protein S5]-alanine N-acetyltransferase
MHLDCGACVIRSWRRGDEGALARHADSRAVWLQMRDVFPHPYTPADAERWVDFARGGRPETNFAITLGDEPVGGIGLTPGRDIERYSAEVGYWLGEAFWGRGLATVAVRGLTRWAFESLGLIRVFALPLARNAASARVLEKAGYRREGLLRASAVKDGQVLDQLLYAITRADLGLPQPALG